MVGLSSDECVGTEALLECFNILFLQTKKAAVSKRARCCAMLVYVLIIPFA